ncbi:MAG: 4'-phosphopantetheinyl transferase family protein [Gemmataceae bacterium]
MTDVQGLVELPENVVRVYVCVLDELPSSLYEQCAAVLSEDEVKRWQRFRFEDDRDQYLVAHGLLRWSLSQVVAVAPERWEFATGDRGKPKIAGPQATESLYFNLTHTRGLVACAVARQEVGIDAECLTRRINPKLAERYFAPFEQNYLKQLPASQVNREFLKIWTLKESYIKALGAGLSRGLDDFWFRFQPGLSPELCVEEPLAEESSRWMFYVEESLSSDHVVSVAASRNLEPNNSFEIRRVASFAINS